MKLKIILAIILFIIGVSCCYSGTTNPHVQMQYGKSDSAEVALTTSLKESPASCFHVQPSGILASRMSFNLDKLINLRQIHSKYTGWGADQIGRWIGSTILESTLLNSENNLPIIEEKVDELIQAQDQEGFYYGDELKMQPDRYRQCWFGQGRGIWNMLEYYSITNDMNTFYSLIRAAEHTVEKRSEWEISRPLSGGIESAVGPMARLGALTENQSFIDWSKDIADNIQHEVAVPSAIPTAHVESTNLYTHEMKPLFHHTHSYLSTTHGVIDLALITGEKKYFDQAKGVFDDSFSSVWINGVFPESYGDLYERIDETCSTVDWLFLALKLFSITGEVQYLDVAELTAMNGLLFEQNNLGGFDTYRSINRHSWGDTTNWGGEQTDCCTMSGGWGLAQVALYTITSNYKGISINLPFDASVAFAYANGTINTVQKIETGKHQLTQEIRVDNTSSEYCNVRIRVPYWSESFQIYVNDKLTDIPVHQGFVDIACLQNSSLHIVCVHPMTLKVIPARRNSLSRDSAGAAGTASEVGIQYGPYVLMYYRELFPYPEKDVSIKIYRDATGKPLVSQNIPADWQKKGVVPLFIEASLNSKGKVFLTPCANLPLMKFIQPDPYVLRFSNIGFSKKDETAKWLVVTQPVINANETTFRDSLLVTIESIFGEAGIYYTLDGSEPTGNSLQYSGPFYLERSTLVQARSIEGSGSESDVCKAYLRKISEPFQAREVNNLKKGVRYAYYEGEWQWLPDFTKLSPVKRGQTQGFDISEINGREDNFALRFMGYIDVPEDGMYTFYSSSDDGSKIWINDFPIVENDGTHGIIEASGDVMLRKGKHKIEVQYFESTLGQDMQISYDGPGINKTEIPPSVLFSKNE